MSTTDQSDETLRCPVCQNGMEVTWLFLPPGDSLATSVRLCRTCNRVFLTADSTMNLLNSLQRHHSHTPSSSSSPTSPEPQTDNSSTQHSLSIASELSSLSSTLLESDTFHLIPYETQRQLLKVLADMWLAIASTPSNDQSNSRTSGEESHQIPMPSFYSRASQELGLNKLGLSWNILEEYLSSGMWGRKTLKQYRDSVQSHRPASSPL